MRVTKIVGWVIGGLIALVAVMLIAIKLFVNPNDYKDRIAAAVMQSTGRELKLPGDINLSVFPWIALELGPASLGNPPGFGDEPFMTLQRVSIRIKVIPLLSKQLEVSKVELDGLDLRLQKNAAGQGNWQMNEADKPKPALRGDEGGSSAQLKSIGGLSVTHGRIAYDTDVIDHFEFETGAIASKSDVPVTIQFDANRGIQGEKVSFKGKLTVNPDMDAGQYRVAGLNFAGTISMAGRQSMTYGVDIPSLEADVKQQTLGVPGFSLSLASLKVTGKLAGTKITDDLHLTGSIALEALPLHEFAPRYGVDLPKTQDPKALSTLSMSTNFAYDAGGAALDDLVVKLDDTALKGSLKYSGGASALVKFDLTADKIDLDRYRPPAGSAPPPKTAAAQQPKPANKDGAAPMALQGSFTLGEAKVAGLDFTNIKAVLDDKGNVAHLNPTEAQIYGGNYTGDITYDQSRVTPAIALDVHLIGIDSAKAVETSKAKGRISGKANVNLKITAQGAGADDIMKTLDGHFDANLTDGAVEGVDLGYELAMAQALIAKQTSTTVPNAHKTKFTSFKLSAPIENGVATTKDLTIVSDVIKVSGQGSINLPTTGIDMSMVASVLKSGGATTVVDVPMKVTGTYTNPSVKPDVEALAKGAVKQKLQDVLKKNGVNGLQDLFRH